MLSKPSPVLLAKSISKFTHKEDLHSLTLEGHLERGIQAVECFKPYIGELLDMCNLYIDKNKFSNTVKMAIWIHDIGKGQSLFQGFIHYNSDKNLLNTLFNVNITEDYQPEGRIRHELMSVVWAMLPSIKKWLQNSYSDYEVVLCAVLKHHLKFRNINKGFYSRGADYHFKKYIDYKMYAPFHTPQFKRIMRLGCEHLGLSVDVFNSKLGGGLFPSNLLRNRTNEAAKFFYDLDKKYKNDFDKRLEIAIASALTKAADLAASALLYSHYKDNNYMQWITEALSQRLTPEDYNEIINQKLGGHKLLDFQEKAKSTGVLHRVLCVVAGCGAGKSLIPFVVNKELTDKGLLNGKLFYTYPTTATTSQGFMDYAANTHIENKLLSHSRSWVDEELKLKDFLELGEDEEDTDIFDSLAEAMRIWRSKIIYCTAHTVLGILENHNKSLYSLPAFAGASFVFDEVASYPPELFEALLTFLEIFSNARIILMSASFTPKQLERIKRVLSKTGEKLGVVTGPKDIESIKRYKVRYVKKPDDAWEKAIAELKNKGKVLWITNQVADSQLIHTKAKKLFKEHGLEVDCVNFHSRFRYIDTVENHKKIVKAFRSSKPAFGITTQIAEMSLDISATLLISANAPIGSLIQRLGRLNRWVALTESGYVLKSGKVCQAIIYPWEKRTPYTTGLETGDLLKHFDGQSISQSQLSGVLKQVDENEKDINCSCFWTDSTWKTEIGTIMPESTTFPILLKEDWEKIKNSSNPRKEAQKLTVSVRGNRENLIKGKGHLKHYRIAEDSYYYHPEIGAYNPEQLVEVKDTYGHETKTRKELDIGNKKIPFISVGSSLYNIA